MNTVPVNCKMCYVEDKEHGILFLYTVKCAMMKIENIEIYSKTAFNPLINNNVTLN